MYWASTLRIKKGTAERSLFHSLLDALLAQVIHQDSSVGGVSQAAERLGLDLTYALSRNAHLSADFLKCVALAIVQPIA